MHWSFNVSSTFRMTYHRLEQTARTAACSANPRGLPAFPFTMHRATATNATVPFSEVATFVRTYLEPERAFQNAAPWYPSVAGEFQV